MKSNHLQSESQASVNLYQDIFDSIADGLIIIDIDTTNILLANPAACKMHGYLREEFIHKSVKNILHPESQEEIAKFFGDFESEVVFEKRFQHICHDKSTFFGEWHISNFIFQGKRCLLGIIRNISNRIQDENILNKRVETRTHEQATLLKISHTLASTVEFQPQLILEQLHEIIEFTHGGLFTLEDSTLTALAIHGVNHLDQELQLRIHLQSPEILSTLFIDHRPVRIPDVWSDHPQAQLLRSLILDETAGLLDGMQSWMWVPLSVRRKIIGVIGIAETRKNFFTTHHADLALSVANQAAITMVNTDLIRQAQDLAVLEERQRLARNLHDAVNQSLFSAGLIAEVLPRLWQRNQNEAMQSLDDLRRLTRGAQAEMRALLAELRPSTITDAKLGDLLQLLANALTGRTSIPVKIITTEEIILPANIQITFYRVCQETLNNVAKHSKASHVDILLKHKGNVVFLHIHDDGIGFDPNLTISGHYGLGMMRERAESVGALFTITSQPGQGTDTFLRWNQPKKKVV